MFYSLFYIQYIKSQFHNCQNVILLQSCTVLGKTADYKWNHMHQSQTTTFPWTLPKRFPSKHFPDVNTDSWHWLAPSGMYRRIYIGNIAILKIAIFWSFFGWCACAITSLSTSRSDGRWSEARATVQRKNLVSSWLQCVLLLSSIAIDNSTSIAIINTIKALKNDKIWARWVRRVQLAAQIESQQARATVESVV